LMSILSLLCVSAVDPCANAGAGQTNSPKPPMARSKRLRVNPK
jgi:hypothetical protein